MKILQINSVCGRQSTGRIATEIKKYVVSNGDECVIAYGEENSIPSFDDYHIGNEFDRYAHALRTRLFDGQGFGSKIPTKKLVEFINEYNPDVIHLHNVHGYYLNLPVLFHFLKEYRRPIIWTMHDCWTFTGHCSHFSDCGCMKWIDGCYACPQKNEYPKSYFDNSKKNYAVKSKLFNGVENLTIVTPSNWLADFVEKSFLGGYKIHTIHNGIDLNKFKPTFGSVREKYGISEDKHILLGVCNVWSKKKGFYDFIELSKLIHKDHVIVLIGVNKEQIQSLSDTGIIAVPNTDSVEELAEWYTTADCFLNLTYEDNFPTVNLEALACGTPVITYHTGGSGECLASHCGAMVSQGDLVDLLKLIEKNDFAKESCLSRSKDFDAKTSFSKYVELYKSLISN